MIIAKAQTLLRNGYQVVPILQEKGIPLLEGHLDDDTWYTEEDAKQWVSKFSHAGLALVAGKNNVYGLDFDIDNKALANKIQKAVLKKYKGVALRHCNKPRFAILFRAEGDELKDVTNGYSSSYKVGTRGKLQQIELIGGRTMTIMGKHRETGNPYKFVKSKEYGLSDPMLVPFDELPTMTLKDVESIFKFLEKNVPEEYTRIKGSSLSRQKSEVTFDTIIKPERRYQDAEVEDLLARSKGDDRGDWLTVGMALHQHFGGSLDGLNRWDEWSKNFQGYEEDSCRVRWESFKLDGGITLGSVAKAVQLKEEGTPEDRYERFRREHVLIVRGEGNGGSMIANLSKSPQESLMRKDEASVKYANRYMKVVGETPTGKPTTKNMKFLDIFLADPERVALYALAYFPSRDRIVKLKGKSFKERYYNTYIPADVEMTMARDQVPKFTGMIDYLFGEGAEWFTNWLAQMIQDPSQPMPVAPLHISTFHGTGRGWMTSLVRLLVGVSNTKSTDMKTIMESQFNEYMFNSVLCVVEETYAQRDKRYEVDDRLRGLIGSSMNQVNVKHLRESTPEVFTRFWLQSNHVDALAIDDLDRRVQPFYCHRKPLSMAEYAVLYDLIGEGENSEVDYRFLNQVYSHLMDYQVNISMLQRSMDTSDRTQLIQSTKSLTAKAYLQFKQLIGSGLFYQTQLDKFMDKYMAVMFNDNMVTVNTKELGALDRIHIRDQVRARFKKPIVVKSFEQYDLIELTTSKIKEQLTYTDNEINYYFTNLEQHNEDK